MDAGQQTSIFGTITMGEGKGKRQSDGKGNRPGKKSKSYHAAQSATLPLNTRGFLISCPNGKERPATYEAMHILQEYYEKLLPKSGEQKAGGESTQDISALLAEEVAQLQDPEQKIFTSHKVGVAGLIYITLSPNASGPGPPQVLLAAAEDIHKTQKCKSRLCMRFTPVETVCYAAVNEMKRAAEKVVLPYFSDTEQPKKFAVQYDHRASAKLDRLAVINAVIEGVKQPPHKVDLKDPDLTVVVQVMKNVCAIGVAQRFREFARYNLRELCAPPEDEEESEAKPDEPKAEREKKLSDQPKDTEAEPTEETSAQPEEETKTS